MKNEKTIKCSCNKTYKNLIWYNRHCWKSLRNAYAGKHGPIILTIND